MAQISRVEPAVPDYIRCLAGTIIIALHYVSPFYGYFTVYYADLDLGARVSACADTHGARPGEGDEGCSLRHSVSCNYVEAKSLEIFYDVIFNSGAPGDEKTDFSSELPVNPGENKL